MHHPAMPAGAGRLPAARLYRHENRLVLRDLEMLLELARHHAASVAESLTILDRSLAVRAGAAGQ